MSRFDYELEVPQASIDATRARWTNDGMTPDWVRAIAAPVVAARLRYWAEFLPQHLRWMLLDDADALDGGTS